MKPSFNYSSHGSMNRAGVLSQYCMNEEAGLDIRVTILNILCMYVCIWKKDSW